MDIFTIIIFLIIIALFKDIFIPAIIVGVLAAIIYYIYKRKKKKESEQSYPKKIPKIRYNDNPTSALRTKDTYETTPVSTFNTKVKGVTFNNIKGISIQKILSDLKGNEEITFEREPNNPYDSNAILVFADNNNIGHLSADIAARYSPQMDNGKIVLKGRVSEITGGSSLNYGCNITVTVYKIL